MADDRSGESLVLIEQYLEQVALDTHRRLGDVAGVAVTMADASGAPVTVGASTELARAVDALQYRIGHGPCLTALHGGGGGYIPSLADERRWDPYGVEAAALGAPCCLSMPVEGRDGVLAVFKVYARAVDGLSEDQRRLGQDAAREVAGGLGLARLLTATASELADRVTAMDSRRQIDLALGILMERVGCDADQAFELLRRYSQQRNVKLRAAAADLVAEKGTTTRAAPFLVRDATVQ